MFTGIVQAIGQLAQRRSVGGDLRLFVKTGSLDLADVKCGGSIAVNGVCLTAVELPGDGFWADVSGETASRTRLGCVVEGEAVNLEKAMTPTSSLGGHFVSGHVDGIGKVLSRNSDGRSIRFVFSGPTELARYIAEKGSICIDGTSLTVNHVHGAEFGVNIVPHTLGQTIINGYRPGTLVNLEVDLIARYLERLLLGQTAYGPGAPGLSYEFLRDHGFAR